MERRPLKQVLAVGLLVAVGSIAWWRWQPSGQPAVAAAVPRRVERIVPEGTRIRVEVINVSAERGLARRGMLALRDAGFDVVGFSSATDQPDTTLVIDRTGHPQWAQLAARVLGNAPVTARPDSSRYVDLTIWLDRRWRPPAEPFHP